MRVLLAVEGSSASEAAIEGVLERPWPERTKVRVLTVLQPVFPALGVGSPELKHDYDWMMRGPREQGRARVREVVARLRAHGLEADSAIREGDPRTEIVDEAQHWRADLIAVGACAAKGLQRWLLGSVSDYVLRHAPCSVEVSRTPAWRPHAIRGANAEPANLR